MASEGGKKERKRPRHRGAEARANADIQTHIHSLGLETTTQYQAWCREHGFTGALNKVWSERHKERVHAQKLQAEAKVQAEVEQYVRSLGYETVEAYQVWCRAHRLSDALHKSPKQRQRERDLLTSEKAQAALSQARRQTQRPQETIRQIIAGHIPLEALKTPALQRVHQLSTLAREEGEPLLEAFCRLLLHCDRVARLEDGQAVIPAYGEELPNTWQYGLLNLARNESHWLRPLEDWRPDTHNPRRQFRSLARYLLANYEVPACMDSGWFLEPSEAAQQRQSWFIHVGIGQNIRRANLPLVLTKQMAHLFLQAPDSYTVDEALRWAQVLGMGGSEVLARAVLNTFLREMTDQEPFWATVLLFLAQNPMLDPAHVGSLLTYIQEQKFVPQPQTLPDGTLVMAPLWPDFTMKGRTIPALLDRVERHQRTQRREERHSGQEWESSSIAEFEAVEWMEEAEEYWTWNIRELRTSHALRQEGRTQSHCVASYAGSCRRGSTSVWSLQLRRGEESHPQHILTIAVNNSDKRINQVRGKHNAHPLYHAHNAAEHKVKRRMQSLLSLGRVLMHRWAEQEGLTIARNT